MFLGRIIFSFFLILGLTTHAASVDSIEKNYPKSTFIFPLFQVQLQSMGYKIDDLLGLKIVRYYNLNIGPELVQFDAKKNDTVNSRIKDGSYILRMTILKGDGPEVLNGSVINKSSALKSYVDSRTKVVNAIGGRITTTIEFEISDLAVPGSRNTIAVELYPADEKKLKNIGEGANIIRAAEFFPHFDHKIYLSQFLPNNEFAMLMFPETRMQTSAAKTLELVSGFVLEAQKNISEQKAQAKKELTVEAFAAHNGLGLSFLDDEQAPPLFDKNLAAKLLRTGILSSMQDMSVVREIEKSLKELCQISFVDNIGFWGVTEANVSRRRKSQFLRALDTAQACAKDPFSYFSLDHKIHVKKVDPRIEWIGGTSQSFNVNSTFDLSAGRAFSSTLRESASASFGAGIRFPQLLVGSTSLVPFLKDLFSASIDYVYTRDSSRSDSVNEGYGNSVSFTRGLLLIEQESLFDISINSYQPCLSVVANEQTLRGLFDGEPPMQMINGLHICDSVKNEKINVPEHYYFFSQHFATGDFLDMRNRENRPFVMSVRGLRDYFVFMNSHSTMLTPKDAGESEKNSPKNLFLGGMALFSQQQKSYPGVYSVLTNPQQLQFITQTTQNSKAKTYYNQLSKTLSPWARKDIANLE